MWCMCGPCALWLHVEYSIISTVHCSLKWAPNNTVHLWYVSTISDTFCCMWGDFIHEIAFWNAFHSVPSVSLLSGFSMCIPPYPFIPYPQPGGQAFVPVDPCTYPCPDLSTQWKQPVFNPFQEQVAMYDSVHCTPKPMGFGVAMPHITGSTAEPSRVPTITGPGLYEHRQTLPPPVSIL